MEPRAADTSAETRGGAGARGSLPPVFRGSLWPPVDGRLGWGSSVEAVRPVGAPAVSRPAPSSRTYCHGGNVLHLHGCSCRHSHVAFDHLEYVSCSRGSEFKMYLILMTFNLNSTCGSRWLWWTVQVHSGLGAGGSVGGGKKRPEPVYILRVGLTGV